MGITSDHVHRKSIEDYHSLCSYPDPSSIRFIDPKVDYYFFHFCERKKR
jgi:hypothetical protein